MTPKPLSPDIAAALDAAGDEPLPVTNPNDSRLYFVIDSDLYEKAMRALQAREDLAAIEEGIKDMEAGRTESAKTGFEGIRKRVSGNE